MNEYEFTLKYAIGEAASEVDSLLNRLYEAGCDDALVGVGKAGRLALQFNREAPSALDAVSSAMRDVRRALQDAQLIEAEPDMVGLTDMAALLKFSRQNMRKIMLNHATDFPLPIHDGTPAIWHLASVLQWFSDHSDRIVSSDLVELARVNMQVNIRQNLSQLDESMDQHLKVLA